MQRITAPALGCPARLGCAEWGLGKKRGAGQDSGELGGFPPGAGVFTCSA